MKTLYFVLLLFSAWQGLAGAGNKQLSFAPANNAPSKPFGKLVGFLTQNFYPGYETGYGITWNASKKHEWFGDINTGYFHQHFFQLVVSLYVNSGYRYRVLKYISTDTLLDIGCTISITDTSAETLNDKREYQEPNNSVHMRTIIPLSLSTSYTLAHAANKPSKIFPGQQQKVKLKFIKEYVPLLPYSSLSLCIIISL